ncbi:MAG: DNA repair protein RecO [Gammaproteobacteria bacterium]|jgi:DNA repair protein RecO (recombination protein O)
MNDHNKVLLEPAWVLHQYPYRDSSLLLEIFSRTHGRVGLIARGARTAKGRWRNQLQILRPLLLSWSLRGELGTLTDAEGLQAPVNWSGRQVLCASYVNELLLRLLTRHDPHPALFDAYQQALARLAQHEEPALRCFEKHLLAELGYGLLLDQDVQSGAPVEASVCYEYLLERGPVRRDRPAGHGLYLHGASLLALHNEQLDDTQACREVKALTRAALDLYLGARPLKTRAVLRQLALLARPDPRAAGGSTET